MVSSVVLKVAMVVLASLVVAEPFAEAAVGCSQVLDNLSPCLGYLRGTGPLPPNCCTRVKALNSAAKTTPDRQAACQCLKDVAGKTAGINPSLAGGLPRKCGVSIGYPISLSVDCKTCRTRCS